jgi:hypothetical protein
MLGKACCLRVEPYSSLLSDFIVVLIKILSIDFVYKTLIHVTIKVAGLDFTHYNKFSSSLLDIF